MAEIAAKIKVEGLAEFRSAMTQASAAVKQSTAEEKKAEAQYKETGDAAAYAQQKTQALTEKLKAQEKQVEAARKACAALEKAGVAPDDKRLVEWKTKLANAEAEMSKTKTALRDVGQGMDDVGSKAKQAGTDIADISKKLDRKTLIEGLNAVSDTMEGVIRRAWQMGQAIWNASTDAANWADSTRDAARAAEMTSEEYQRMSYACQFFGLQVSDLTGKEAKLTQAMDEQGRIAVGDWAVDTIDRVTGQKRNFSNVLMDIIDGLGQIEDPVRRDQEAMRLFGKSYASMRGLIEDGQEAWQQRYNEAPIVREETVDALADTADVLKTMDAQLETLKMEVLTALSPSIKTIAEAISELAKSFTEFLQTEEGQQLLKDMGTALENIVTALTGDVDFAGIVQTAANALSTLNDGLTWISKHGNEIRDVVVGLGIAFGGLKLTSFGLNVANTVSSLTHLLGHGVSSGSGTAGSAANAVGRNAARAAAGSGLAGKLGGVASGVGSFLLDALPVAGMSTAVIGAALLPAWLETRHDREERQAELDSRVAQAETDAAQIGDSAQAALDIVHLTAQAMGNTGRLDISGLEIQGDLAEEASALETLAGMDTEGILTGRQRLLLAHGAGLTNAGRHELLDSAMLTAAESITGGRETYSGDVMSDVSDTLDAIMEIREALEDEPGSLGNGSPMFDLIDQIVENEGVMSQLSDNTKDLLGAWYSGGNESPTAFSDAADLLEVIENELNDAWDDYVSDGRNVGEGVAQGIRESTPAAVAEAVAMANSIHAAVRRTLEINSPSRVMAGLGQFAGMGLAEGIDRSIAQVEASATRMARAAENPVAGAAGNVYNGGSTVNNHYFHVGTYNQNTASDLNALARQVIGIQRGERQGYGQRR